MKTTAMKTVVALNACQRMSRSDMAQYFNRSLPWLVAAEKRGIIPPAVRCGCAPFWVLPSVEQWTARLVQEAENRAMALKAADQRFSKL